MELTFSGRRAVVTGAGRGIGRAVAKALVEYGVETYAVSRTQATLDSLQAEVPAMKTVCVDLTDWDVTRKAMADIGPVQLLVHSAGVLEMASFLEITPELIDKHMDIYFKARLNINQVFAKQMIDSGSGGSIVNISGLSSMVSTTPLMQAYSASLAASDVMTRAMTLELGPHNIRVNSVLPTLVRTGMSQFFWSQPDALKFFLDKIPLGKIVEIRDVVAPTLFLLSDQASMITGTCIPIDGGLAAC